MPQSGSSPSAAARCLNCGRFVPRAAEAAGAAARALRSGSETGLDLAANPLAEPRLEPRTLWDEWKLAAEVRRAQRLLTSAHSNAVAPTVWRRDEPHPVSPAESWPNGRYEQQFATSYRFSEAQQRRRICAAAVASGLIAVGCGFALVIRAHIADGELSNHFGVPLMLLGVFALLLGMLVQMHWLRRTSRAVLDRTRLIELRLQEYRSAALLLGVGEESGAASRCLSRVA